MNTVDLAKHALEILRPHLGSLLKAAISAVPPLVVKIWDALQPKLSEEGRQSLKDWAETDSDIDHQMALGVVGKAVAATPDAKALIAAYVKQTMSTKGQGENLVQNASGDVVQQEITADTGLRDAEQNANVIPNTELKKKDPTLK